MSHTPSIIQWNANKQLSIMEFRLEVPIHTVGKVCVYKVPVSEVYPEGYYVSLNTSSNPYVTHEPPHKASEVLHLCTIQYSGVYNDAMIPASVLYCHQDISLYVLQLNPQLVNILPS